MSSRNEEESIVNRLKGYLDDQDLALIKHAGDYAQEHDHDGAPAYLEGKANPKIRFWCRILRRK